MTNTPASWTATYRGERLPSPDEGWGPLEPGSPEVAALTPIRELHDWDGAAGIVTTYVCCEVDGREVWGSGAAPDRVAAMSRAMVAVANIAMRTTAALLHT